MSVIVKGMEMPKNCYECPMESANWCNILEKRVESIDRHQDCPLIEIPPHGRLVDINTILHDGNRGCIDELINDPELSGQIKVGVSAARVVVCSAPTIIEAEE